LSHDPGADSSVTIPNLNDQETLRDAGRTTSSALCETRWYPSTRVVGFERLGAAGAQVGASSSTDRATRIRRPQPQEQASALRDRPGPAGLACSARRHSYQRLGQLSQHLAIAGGGQLGNTGR